MNARGIHNLISFSNLFKLLLGISISIQLIVITFNHFSGYYILENSLEFLTRLLLGTFLSLLASFMIAYPDLMVINKMNQHFSWERNTLKRIVSQLGLSVLVASIVAIIITIISNSINPYKEGVQPNIIYNVLIFCVVNIILVLILEAWIFFIERDNSKEKSKELEGRLSQLRFEILKSQIDSHFMFNSLNVLSGLIEKDTRKAQDFIDEFSNIYRYVLDTIERPVVSVNEEISFARSYMFLQQIRYGEPLKFSIDLPTKILGALLPPLSLQVALENACKHNLIDDGKPLRISITNENDTLVITNNIQLKIVSRTSKGTGQPNLKKRYELLSDKLPEFRIGTSKYKVILPLINDELL